jgi:cold shock CspA family protein
MSQRAIDWDVAPHSDPVQDTDELPPTVLPVRKPQPVRHVGIVKWYNPPKAYGFVSTGQGADAMFNVDDVAPADRERLVSGHTVTFHVFNGPDGRVAKEVRIDGTTLPPPPDATLVSKGWR